jgi:hypothetical protein
MKTKYLKRRLHHIEELAEHFPKRPVSLKGRPMEPINLVVTGHLESIKYHLEQHGWFVADEQSVQSWFHSLYSTLMKRPYRHGPMLPGFIGKHHHHDIGFERPTYQDNYRQRHHLRLWRTRFKVGKKRVWIGILSFDKGIGIGHFGMPTHHIHPSLLWEEHFLAHSLGIQQPAFVRLDNYQRGHVSNGDPFVYDGRALVLEFN